jgi:selenocysteine-specific elongation factor
MIIGTAGHIDHGKTTWCAPSPAWTPTACPRKKRGISIELGYAYLDTPTGERIGFIDVPGHERLVHTMAAGASGIDHALLLVAADDGPMPQTREHLAVLSLLGIARGTVVTKATAPRPSVAGVCGRDGRAAGRHAAGRRAHLRRVAHTGAGVDALRAPL